MLGALKRVFARLVESRPDRDLAADAARILREEDPAATVILLHARYLPHGGTDRIALRLRLEGGTIERVRMDGRGTERRGRRELDADEASGMLADLEARRVWQMADLEEPIIDGLAFQLVFARKGRTHTVHVHSGFGASEQKSLLDLLTSVCEPVG
jgi:hypothetical protein